MKITKSYIVTPLSEGGVRKAHVRVQIADGRNFGVSSGMVRNQLNQLGVTIEGELTNADCQVLVGMELNAEKVFKHVAGEVVDGVTFTKEGHHIGLEDFNPVGNPNYQRGTEASKYQTSQKMLFLATAKPVEEDDNK